MAGIDRWLKYLDKMQVRYSHSVHPRAETARQTADAERIPAHEFVKVVIYFDDSGFGIAVVPADRLVDLSRIGRLLGSSFIRLANESELRDLFPNCEVGAMPPFGDSCALPVIVDVGVVGDYIAFTIGTHRDVIRMSYADFQRLAKPITASVAANLPIAV